MANNIHCWHCSTISTTYCLQTTPKFNDLVTKRTMYTKEVSIETIPNVIQALHIININIIIISTTITTTTIITQHTSTNVAT